MKANVIVNSRIWKFLRLVINNEQPLCLGRRSLIVPFYTHTQFHTAVQLQTVAPSINQFSCCCRYCVCVSVCLCTPRVITSHLDTKNTISRIFLTANQTKPCNLQPYVTACRLMSTETSGFHSNKNKFGTNRFNLLCKMLRHAAPTSGRRVRINILKSKRNPLYIRHQSVPRCKHFIPRL
jgi:hypothetical protein